MTKNQKIKEVPGTNGKYLIDITEEEVKCYSVSRKRYLRNTPDSRDGRIFWTLSLNKKGKHYQSSGDASKDTGIERSNITRCCNGVLKTAGGYKWKYVE